MHTSRLARPPSRSEGGCPLALAALTRALFCLLSAADADRTSFTYATLKKNINNNNNDNNNNNIRKQLRQKKKNESTRTRLPTQLLLAYEESTRRK